MDKKMKQRILGVALVTLVLMAVLPELIKSPVEPDGMAATVEMPLPPPSAVRPSFTEPKTTLDLNGANVNANADTNINANANANANANTGINNTATGVTLNSGSGDDITPQTLVLTDPSAPRPAGANPLPGGTLDAGTAPSVTATTEPRVAAMDETAQDDATFAAGGGERDNDRQTLAMIPSPPAGPAPTDPARAIETPAAGDGQAAADSAEPPPPVVETPPIKLLSLRHRSSDSAADSPSSVKPSRAERDRQWVVQAGAFAVSKNASLLRDKLRARQFPTRLEPAKVDGRTLYLVQIGPFPSKDQGRQAQRRLRQEIQLEGEIRLY